MIVSDADMCDGIRATGILHSYQYNLSHNNLLFEINIYPTLNMSANDYMSKKWNCCYQYVRKITKTKGFDVN